MMNPSTDLGAHVKAVFCGATNTAGAPLTIVAGGAGDAVAVTGATINTATLDNPDSCTAVISFITALAASETLSIAAEVQYSSDGTAFDTAVSLQSSTVVATGAGNKTGVVEFDISLRSQKQYFRINFTPDLSRALTDTAIVSASVNVGGMDVVPHG